MNDRLLENLRSVRERIEAACARAGRPPGCVHLVAVTKYVGPELCAALADLGQRDQGESRAQALVPRAAWCTRHGNDVRWHFIGHLQRNKARAVVRVADEIHSVDSLRLLETLERVAREEQRRPRIYLEVDFTEVDARRGLRPQELPALVAAARASSQLELAGLMTMAPEPDPAAADTLAAARRAFAQLAELRETLPADAFAQGRPLLSMGMSSDFEPAVEAGADVVRVGSALFEGLAIEPTPGPAGGRA